MARGRRQWKFSGSIKSSRIRRKTRGCGLKRGEVSHLYARSSSQSRTAHISPANDPFAFLASRPRLLLFSTVSRPSLTNVSVTITQQESHSPLLVLLPYVVVDNVFLVQEAADGCKVSWRFDKWSSITRDVDKRKSRVKIETRTPGGSKIKERSFEDLIPEYYWESLLTLGVKKMEKFYDTEVTGVRKPLYIYMRDRQNLEKVHCFICRTEIINRPFRPFW